MSVKKLRGVNVPYKKQLLIRAICLNYNDRPQREREKIDRLCLRCGGEYHEALFRVMTTQDSIVSIAQRYYVSEGTLYRIRKKFYEEW